MILTKSNYGDIAIIIMIIMLDVGLSGIASLVAILLMRWMSEPFFGFQRFTLIWLMFSVLGSVIGFYLTKTYKIVIRYFNFNDTSALVKATLIKELLMGTCILFNLVGSGHVRLDILTLVLDALFTVFVLVIVRVVMIKILKTNSMSIEESVERLRVIVYGTSVKAIAMVDRLDESPHYDIIGFLSDNPATDGQIINGRRVFAYKDKAELAILKEQQGIECILYANEDKDAMLNRGLSELLLALGRRIRVARRSADVTCGSRKQQAVRELTGESEYIADGMGKFGRVFKRCVVFVISSM